MQFFGTKGVICSNLSLERHRIWSRLKVWVEGSREEFTMTLYAELPKAAAGAQFFRSNSCPQCGDKLLAPEWSEHVNERCIRHFWSCEACSYEFESSVYLPAR